MLVYKELEDIAKNLILIDGLTRSGKSAISGIVTSLKSVEHIQLISMIDHIVPAVATNGMSANIGKSIIRMALNELSYNLRISRHVNFRYDDWSGVNNYYDPNVYYKRLAKEEGSYIVDEIKQNPGMIPLMTHDLMANLSALDALELDYKMLAMFRNPIDNIHSMWKRGWGERFGVDPLAYTLTYSHQGHTYPWHCVGIEQDWLEANPMERCILIATKLLKQSVDHYRKSEHKHKIHIIQFEKFVENSDDEVNAMCSFLGVEKTAHTPLFMAKQRCPRVINKDGIETKLKEFKQGVDASFYERLCDIIDEYESQLYGLV